MLLASTGWRVVLTPRSVQGAPTETHSAPGAPGPRLSAGGQETGTWGLCAARCVGAVLPTEFRVSRVSAPSRDLTGPLDLTFSETQHHLPNAPVCANTLHGALATRLTTSWEVVVLLLESSKHQRACIYGPETGSFIWAHCDPSVLWSHQEAIPFARTGHTLVPSLFVLLSLLGPHCPAGPPSLFSSVPILLGLRAALCGQSLGLRAVARWPGLPVPQPGSPSAGHCGSARRLECLRTLVTPQGTVFYPSTVSSLLGCT